MFGLNPFAPVAPDIDPLELQKIRGLLGGAFAPPPQATINPVGRPMPGQPQDYNDARNDMGNFQAQPTLVQQPGMTLGRQMLPPIDAGAPPQAPVAPIAPVPLPPRRPDSFGGPDANPIAPPMQVTPQQRTMEASSAGKPQDVRQNDPISGFDSGLDKMMTDPLFHMGVALLANPRNPGQGLAAGLQGWSAASRQAKRDKMAEEAAKRKNIHWFMQPDGTLAGVNVDNPAELIVPPGQTPKRTEGQIIQPGQEGGIPGFIQVRDPNGNLSLHAIPQTPEQKAEAIANDERARQTVRQQFKEEKPFTPTPGQMKMIADSDAVVERGRDTLETLKKMRELSSKSWNTGFGADVGSKVGLPGAAETLELDTLAKKLGMQDAKTIFGSQPSNYEGQLLQKIQGSPNMPRQVRDKLYDDLHKAMVRRMEYNRDRSDALSTGEYTNPNSAFRKKYRDIIDAEISASNDAFSPQPSVAGSVQEAPQGAQSSSAGAPTAINRKTGERMILRNGQWEKM